MLVFELRLQILTQLSLFWVFFSAFKLLLHILWETQQLSGYFVDSRPGGSKFNPFAPDSIRTKSKIEN